VCKGMWEQLCLGTRIYEYGFLLGGRQMLLFITEALNYASFFSNPYSTTSYCAYKTQSVYKQNTFKSTANFLLANSKQAASST